MSLRFVRRHYGVPAYRGAVVSRPGRIGPQYGLVTSSFGPTINVRWNGHVLSEQGVHPVNGLTWHPKKGWNRRFRA